MTKILNVRLTRTANAKLEEIYQYSCDNWGVLIARKYMEDLEMAIVQASINQEKLKRKPKYSNRFTYSIVREHIIFFEVRKDILFVVTIFHRTMDIENRLIEEMGKIKQEIII